METDKPIFRYAQINDLHMVSRAGIEPYELVNEKGHAIIHILNRMIEQSQLDFVVGLGDIVHGGHLSALATDMVYAKEMIATLSCPYFPIVGNHEVDQAEDDPMYESAYRKVFGHNRINYSFLHKGIRFVALNNSGATRATNAVAEARAHWLSKQLKQADNTPVVVFCHIPLVPIREPSILDQSFVISSSWDKDGRCLEVLRRHRDKVVAIFSGHLHLTGKTDQDGITHCCISGTASYPCDYAICSLWHDELEVEVRQMPDEFVTPLTNIHGKRRHGRDFTDVRHPDPESYVKGMPDERHFKIALNR